MWFGIIGLWSLAGFLILFMIGSFNCKLICEADGVEFFNPRVIYKKINVNWFGAIVLTIFFNLLCPVLSAGYWFYKICTIGRK